MPELLLFLALVIRQLLSVGLVWDDLTRISLVLDVLSIQKSLKNPFRVGHRVHVFVHLWLAKAADLVEEIAGALSAILDLGLLRLLASSESAGHHWRVLIEGQGLLAHLVVVRSGGRHSERPHHLSTSSGCHAVIHHHPGPSLLALQLLCLSQLPVFLSDCALHDRCSGGLLLLAHSKIALARRLLGLPPIVDLDLAEAGDVECRVGGQGLRDWSWHGHCRGRLS